LFLKIHFKKLFAFSKQQVEGDYLALVSTYDLDAIVGELSYRFEGIKKEIKSIVIL